ncbi:hypothetical protein [Streptomyces sp. NPDC059398]|uniref:hypothetical protein n=1 Tax=Streptomyces sp. NPDC059398 TaxID=3346820 RepID=UPI0036B8648F
MTTAQYVATIDRLRARAFPLRRGWSDTGPGGPGYHLAVLVSCDALSGGGRGPEAGDQFRAEYEGLVAVLDSRWGEAQVCSLWSMLTRRLEGEEIPEPWDELCTTMSFLHLWRAEERWIAIGAVEGAAAGTPEAQAARELRKIPECDKQELRLVVVVTEVDPP